MWKFQQKMKQVTRRLMTWSKEQIGDVFLNLKEQEHKLLHLELQYIDSNKEMHRAELHMAQAQYTMWLKVEKTLLKQKANIKWLEEGDSNSKYFHTIINERSRKLTLHKIKNQDGQYLQGDQEIG